MKQGTTQYLIGTGGWEHDVFDGCFYPQRGATATEKLRFYSKWLDVTEVRATFWDDSLGADDAREWCRAVVDNKRFSFLVKLHTAFTHKRELRPQAARNARGLLQELLRNGRLGAVLAQFPYSFTNTSANRFHLVKLAEVFRGFPLHVEFRNASWNHGGLVNFLIDNGLSSVSADLPRVNQFMAFLTRPAGPQGYLRFHGRNEKGWLVNAYDARYDYLYNSREIVELRRRVEAMGQQAERVFVTFNNTTNGKALANAFQLRAALAGGSPVSIPEYTIRAFPHLVEIGDRATREPALFESEEFREAM